MSHSSNIIQAIGRLSPVQQSIMLEVVDYLLRRVHCTVNPTSDIVSASFQENIANRLLLHHATNEELFKKKSFEYAFKAASIADGKSAQIVANQTHPGADVIVDNVKFSLKTEASANISQTGITISKLMEARWLRDCVSNKDYCNAAQVHVCNHLNGYDRILMLRAWTGKNTIATYELIEIPLDVLLAVKTVREADFGKRTDNGTNSAIIRYKGTAAFNLRFDGSVEKVTISNLLKSACKFHAKWEIPH